TENRTQDTGHVLNPSQNQSAQNFGRYPAASTYDYPNPQSNPRKQQKPHISLENQAILREVFRLFHCAGWLSSA
ncbi:hypothetical protein ACFPID_03675, partial [Bifidobacterium leontopitheci]